MIVFEGVEKSYAKELFSPSVCLKALDGLSFELNAGRTLGLVGANGAGKSTSIRLLMDFIRPDKGTITVFGQSPSVASLRQRIGYLPEVASFPANLTILDLLRYTARTCGLSRTVLQQRSEMLLSELDLWTVRHRKLRTYSKGMQQRANFTLALINEPQLLVLDEPMSGLDPLGRHKIIALIQQLKEQGKSILFCSHILDDVDKLVDDILLLHQGRKLFYGSPSQLLALEGETSIEAAFVRCVGKRSSE